MERRPTAYPGAASPPAGRPRWFLPVQIGIALALLGYVAWLLLDPAVYMPARDLILFTALLVAFAGCALMRAVIVRTERMAWLLLGIGALAWAAGDAVYTMAVGGDQDAPYPAVVNVGYLSFFAFAYCAVILLLIGRTQHRPVGAWIDGVLVACGAGAYLGVLAPHITGNLSGDGLDTVVTMATPASDLVLLCLLIGIIGVLGLRAGAMWWLLAAGAALLWVADSLWLLGTTVNDYAIGAPLDLLWLLAFAAVAAAAWLLPVPERRVISDSAWSAIPAIVTAASLLLLLTGSQVPIPVLSSLLAAVAIVLGLARTGRIVRAASRHAEVVRQAYLDDLTGLGNRRSLARELGSHSSGALILLDVDDFRQVNDTLGHLAGDQVLREIAPRLQEVCEGRDVVLARLGGDEFVVFLRGPHEVDHALAIADRLRTAMAQPMRIDDLDLNIDTSMGIALAPQHGDAPEELLRAADAALYRAQHTRSGVTVFEPGLDSSEPGHLIFQQELRQAIAAEELFCVYQPKIDTATGSVVGVEALVRWRHPERGELGPTEFLAVAERSALIRPLTGRVLRLAIQQLGEWRDAGLDLTMSVNLSAMNLLDPRTPVLVAELLAEHRVPSDRLILEITESVFLSDARRGREVVGVLRGMGCRISIDDYGTGFSSLGQIRRLLAQELKLDSSFVVGVAVRPELQSIVAATVLLAHGLKMTLVAEGVESQADLRMVSDLGCDLAQGFAICPPLAPLDAGIWLARRSMLPAQRPSEPSPLPPAGEHGGQRPIPPAQDRSDRRTA